ncbi:MAG: hypothetical protein RLZZ141_367 [Pseudomonadota bacterium]|jgi:hypothetical protein
MSNRRNPLASLVLTVAFSTLALGTAHAAGGHGGDAKSATLSPYIQMRPLNVNVLRASGARTVVTLEVGVFVADPNVLKRADASQPRLQAAFGQVVQGYMLGLPLGGVPNADYLSQLLQKEADRVVGQRGVKLLLGTIIIN